MKTFSRFIVVSVILMSFLAVDSQAKYRLVVKKTGQEGYLSQLFRSYFAPLLSKKGGATGYEYVSYVGKGKDTYIWCKTKGYDECPASTLRDKIIESNIDDNDREAADYAIAQIKKGVNSGNKTLQSGRYVWWNKTNLEITVSVD